MAILNINGRRVKVDDSFLSLSPEQQNATVEEIAASFDQPESVASQDLRSDLSSLTQGMTGELPGGNLDRARYEQLPEWQKPLVALGDFADLAANGATFGYGNKLAAGLRAPFTDKTYSEELEGMRDKTQEARNRAGSAAIAAELTGAVATPLALANRGATLLGRFGTAGMTGGTGLAARTGLAAVEGSGYGALTAAGNDQDVSQGALFGLLGGGAGNLAGEALSAGISKVAGLFNKKPTIPQIEDIEAAAKAARARADQSGVAYSSQAVDKLNTNLRKALTDIGYHPRTMPGASAAVDEIMSLQGQNVTLSGLDTIRKIASGGYIQGNKQNNLAVTKIIQAIDDLADNAAAGDVLMGNGQAGAAALKEARQLESRLAKFNKVQYAIDKAERNAAASGSGGNVDNATRQRINRLLDNPRGFSGDEKAALETIVRGTTGQNALRLAGKFAPTGVVSGVLSGGAGFGVLGPAGLALPLAGAGAKAAADQITKQNVQRLADIILAGGSRSATQAAPNAVQRLSQAKRDELARILMAIGASQAANATR